MKTSVIPAQVTTVEDKIIGNFNFKQISLVVISILLAGFIFIVIPPTSNVSILKIFTTFYFSSILLLLAYKFKGKLVIDWSFTILRYLYRPRVYVINRISREQLAISINLQNPIVLNYEYTPDKHTKHKLTPQIDLLSYQSSRPYIELGFKVLKNGTLDVEVF